MSRTSVETALWTLRRLAAPADAPLLERFAATRDPDAFAQLVERHGGMVLGVCRRVLRDLHDAEDVFQATFLVLARKAHAIRNGHALSSWLHGVAFRLALKSKAAAARRRRCERHCAELRPEPSTAVSAWNELRAILDEELERLPTRYQAPLVLCYLEGKTRDEAAEQLGWSTGMLKGVLERGRALLRQRLTRHGLSLSAALCGQLITPRGAKALPAELIRMALRAVAVTPTVESFSASATTLAEGFVQEMVLRRVKLILAIALTFGVAGGAGVFYSQSAGKEPRAAEQTSVRQSTMRNSDDDPLPAGALARFGSLRIRHGSVVTSLAASADGRTMVSSSWDCTVRIWDTVTGKEIRCLAGHEDRVWSAALSPDGKTLASTGENLRVWDVAIGKEIYSRTLPRRQTGWPFVLFAPNGKLLAIMGHDAQIVLLDAATGTKVHTLAGHENGVLAGAFSPDGAILASAGADQRVRLWDVAAGTELRQLDGHKSAAGAVAFSADGKLLASGGADAAIILWDPQTGKEMRRFQGHTGNVRSLAFSADAKTLASASGTPNSDRTVRVWDVASGAERRKLPGGMRGVTVFVNDGKTLAVAVGDCGIRLFDPATGEERLAHPGDQGWIHNLAFAPDGKVVAVGGNQLTLREFPGGRIIGRLQGHLTGVYALAFAPDGRTLATGGRDGTIRLWDVAKRREVGRLAPAPIKEISEVWVNSLAFMPNGRQLISAGRDNSVRLWDIAAGKELRQFEGHQQPVWNVAVSPDGKTLATASVDQLVRLWDIDSGQTLRTLSGHQSDVEGVAFSPDGRLVASGGSDGMVLLWHVATGKRLHILREPPEWSIRLYHYRDGKTLAFSPDGRTLAWGSWQSVVLWETATGEQRLRYTAHRGEVPALAFRPDGRVLATAGFDTTTVFWDLTGQLQAGRLPVANLAAADMSALWDDLSGPDAARAYRAIWKLVASPVAAVRFLKQHLRPWDQFDRLRLARLIGELDDDQFATRENANKDLEKMGAAVLFALRRALEKPTSAEVRQRLERIIAKHAERPLSSEHVQAIRALEVLEHIDTAEARDLLQSLAQGSADLALTNEAQLVTDRMKKRNTAQ